MDPKRLIAALFLLQGAAILLLVTKFFHPRDRTSSYVPMIHVTINGTNFTTRRVTALTSNMPVLNTITRDGPNITTVQGAAPAVNLTLETRGMMTGCTLADIKKKPGVVLLTTTNTGFLDLTLNMLESIKRTGLCVNTTVVAEDEYTYEYLRNRSVADPTFYVQKTHFGVMFSEKLMVFSKKYNQLVNKRQQYILDLLERGSDVLLSDSDTFWFRDPFSYFQGDFDMSFVDERSPYPTRLPTKSLHCAGLGYFKPTNRTVHFFRRWIELLNIPGEFPGDQAILNVLLHEDKPVHMEVKPLPVAHFPHALVFYKKGWRKANKHTIIMHNVGIRGHDKKVEMFKANGMWLLD